MGGCMSREFEDEEVSDIDEAELEGLSYIAVGAVHFLKSRHKNHRKKSWNVTKGICVGGLHQTPKRTFWGKKEIVPLLSHDDEFPLTMYNVITRAEKWVDITSLSPPDGKFCDQFKAALLKLAETAEMLKKPITVRLLFGNIVGMPVDCDQLLLTLTEDLPADSRLHLYVTAWRVGVSWNHSKIIAIDGKYLFTGGHNLWDAHYLQTDPVHDISMELEGEVAHDGHQFANQMWAFVREYMEENHVVNMMHIPNWFPLPILYRVNVSHWPGHINKHPPMYPYDQMKLTTMQKSWSPPTNGETARCPVVHMLTIGRLGSLHPDEHTANPSDTAIFKMLACAKSTIRMSLQDLGPLTLPGLDTPCSIPGGTWPTDYLYSLACAIYDHGVQVEIVLSNPHAVPGGLSPLAANYGNGWTCIDVAAEIVKAIKNFRRDAEDDQLRVLAKNLRITFLRSEKSTLQWPNGEQLGNHAKFFMIDDMCYYIGSQNLYIANLAEWGVLIDDKAQTQKVLEEYWNPMWKESYVEGRDVNIDAVMDGLHVNRDGKKMKDATIKEKIAAAKAKRSSYNIHANSKFHTKDHEEHGAYHGVGSNGNTGVGSNGNTGNRM